MNAPTAAPLHVVARFLDGSVLKGTTRDFAPNRPEFHVIPDGSAQAMKVQHAALKAVFFVKSLTGNKDHVEAQDLENARGQGRRVQVTFKDGEVVSGYTVGYAPDRPGFFVIPIDPRSNNLRVFVVNAAVARVDFVAARPIAAAGGARG
jgi:uncharacterized protein DUF6982